MKKKVHFIAIGGSVMHQLALTLQDNGYQVSGSDDEIYEPAAGILKEAGLLPVAQGWFPERITPDMDAIILGMHARGDNPELLRAQELHLPVFSFPEYIYQESKDKTRVVIGGSHGKTTITAMIMHVLKVSGKDFDYLVGAKLPGFTHSVRISQAPVIICEGDEYPASALQKIPKFHFYQPHIAVLSGIAWDHINVFPTFENYVDQFAHFIHKIETGGWLIYNETDPVLADLVKSPPAGLRLQPYGIPRHHIQSGVTTVSFGDHSVRLQVFGAHNLQNLNAARLVCRELGIGEAAFLEAIATFQGASRRLEKMFHTDQSALYRDFAHAPSKVKASIQALKSQFPDRKLIAVLELHTFSSLNQAFLTQYRGAMAEADAACVYFSRHALEIKHLPPLSPEAIREGFGREDLVLADRPDQLEAFLSRQPVDQTNLLMMSSGSFEGLGLDDMVRLWQKN